MSVGALFTLNKNSFYKYKDSFKEMEKIEYKAPEMEVLDLKLDRNVLLSESSNPPFDPEPSEE